MGVLLGLLWPAVGSAKKKAKKKRAERAAIDEIALYVRHDGSPGHPQRNWIIANRSKSRRIVVTIEKRSQTTHGGPPVSQTVALEPGQVEGVASAEPHGTGGALIVSVKGARFAP
jgi:hypothetical protein